MTPQEFMNLLEYIKENNSWGDKMYEVCHIKKRRAIKYVDSVFDSRDGIVWKIIFRDSSDGKDKIFRVENQKDIQLIYDWLNEIIEY